MKAVDDWVIVKYDKRPEKSDGGIYLPKEIEAPTVFAEVLDIGPNIEKPTFGVGDRVLVFRQPGVEYGDVRFTKPGNILAKICSDSCDDCEKKNE